MATAIITGGTPDGEINGASNNYAVARATSAASNDTNATAFVGQQFTSPTHRVYRGFPGPFTLALPAGAVITGAVLKITADSDLSATDFLIRVYRVAWSDPLATAREANYDAAYGGGAVLEGTLQDTSGGWSPGTQYSLTVDHTVLPTTGEVRYALVSSRDVAGNTPTGAELVSWCTADHGTPASRPQLEVTYTVPAAAPNSLAMLGAGV